MKLNVFKMVEDSRNTDEENYRIGQRIACDGHYGTICYVGAVDDTVGIWLGIDWDNPARGKHNGTHHNKEYFKTLHPTSGSFVRPGKVKSGISCVEAIKNRYGYVDDALAGVDRENISKLRKEINAPFLEMVGFSKVNRKQSNFNQLSIVSVREECVSTSGGPGNLGELFPNIQELDLSKNLINSWVTVGDICSQLTRLDRLDLSENVIPTDEGLNHLNGAFSNVTQLAIAHMNYTWRDVEACTLVFPVLRTLSVPFNKASILETPINNPYLLRLRTLTLEGNSICNWDEILKLGCLDSLESLNVNSNEIERINFPCDSEEDKTKAFPALRQLLLSSNLIHQWSSITELEKLQNLSDLKFRDNPVLKAESPETARQLIIARISGLKVLNSTEIPVTERRDAEHDYMKLFAKEWLQLSENCDTARREFLRAHPRFPRLVEQYGGPEIINSKADEMKSDVITVEFVSMNEASQGKSVKRKVLNEMEVQKLTGIAQRLFKIGGKIPILSFVQSKLSKEEIPLDKPLQQLKYYSIQNGDRVLVRW
ncbi:tubulin-specific chaperone E [Fopius arisanus]|uniref:Tubulin-specific chaperone E n=1 Tax=Fopius arisanus TaxID=64838 RepID=A0A9R1U0Q7_9HYME|nr:PREDICTED: tubulin-specific chaperone E [Fopius arisanus]